MPKGSEFPEVTSATPATALVPIIAAGVTSRITLGNLLTAAHHVAASGWSLMLRVGGGAGFMTETPFAENTILYRGRLASAQSNLTSYTPNVQRFTEGATETKSGYADVRTILNRSAGISTENISLYSLGLGVGEIQFTIKVSACDSFGVRYYADYSLRIEYDYGADPEEDPPIITIVGTPNAHPDSAPELDLSFTPLEDGTLDVNIDVGIVGVTNLVNMTMCTAYVWTAFNVQPPEDL